MKKLFTLAALLCSAAMAQAQVGYTYDSASNGDFQKAFDGNTNSKFEGNNLAGNWLIIKTTDSQPHVVKSYAITTHDDGSYPNRAPKTWTLEGSNDKTNWTLVDMVTNDPIQNQNYTTFTFNDHFNFNAYTYLRFTMLTMKGTGWTQIGEFAVTDVADADVDAFRAEKKTVFQSKLTNLQGEVAGFNTALGEDDPWTLEYVSILGGLNEVLNSTTDFNYGGFGKASNLVSGRDQFTGDVYAFDGSTANCWGDGHWSQLIDGNTSTKWGGNFSGSEGSAEHVQYVIFRLKEPIQPYFYKLVTGNDTKTNTGRNWKDWQVYGANFSSYSDITKDAAEWVLLDNRVDISETYLPMENYYPAMLNFTEKVEKPYYYYMVKVTKAHDGAAIQMSEMSLHTQAEFEDMRTPFVEELEDFAAGLDALVVESEYETGKTEFATKFNELKTTDDAVQLTLLYNELVALRNTLSISAAWLSVQAITVDGVVQIATAANLKDFSTVVNGGNIELEAVLTANIDMEGTAMSPIGTNANPYKGSFDGQGFTIANYTYNESFGSNLGLFGTTNGATIQKVLLQNANILGRANVGGIVGNANNSTINCCAVVNSTISGHDHVATIAGNAAAGAVVSNCYSNSDVVSDQYQAGGLVGTVLSGAVIEKNLFAGTVKCENGGNASGLVSLIDANDANPTIRNNVVAAVSVEGGSTFTLVNAGGRAATYANNFILDTTVYSTGAKSVSNENDQNGKQISLSEATKADFYYDPLGWDMTNDWQYVARFVFPVLAYMEAVVPAEDIAVTSAGYATYFTKAELDFGQVEGVEAYIPQLVNDEYVHLEPITYVPAGVGIVVKAAAGTYNIPYSRIIAKDVPSDLKAAPAGFTATGKEYILAKPEGEAVGFYKAEGVIAEGKGYIELTGASDVKDFYGFEFNDATGIEETLSNSPLKGENIFNLAGQRLNKMQKGINIVAGKKVLK